MAITIIVTNAGRAALVNAQNDGTNAVTVTQLGITATVFAPSAAQVALPGEIKRIPLASGVVVADDQIHVTASDVTPDAYAMHGFALYLDDGTLFAIYGQAGAILNKTAQSMMLLAADIAFADIDAALIEFGDTNFVLPPATTEILGLVELATTAEAQAGTDPSRVLTPLTGKQSVLGWLLSQDGSGSGLDADLLDGLHASAFALAGHTHGTMATQNANNVNITGGALNGVTLGIVNGSAASPGLFFTGDIDTGLFRAGPDSLAFATAGEDRARFTSAGHLALGRSDASCRLHVLAPASDEAVEVARFQGATASGGDYAFLSIISDHPGNMIQLRSAGALNGGFAFLCGATERMRLSSTGTLMLGATDAVSSENLLLSQGTAGTCYALASNVHASGAAGFAMHVQNGSWAMRATANGVFRIDQDYLTNAVPRVVIDTAGNFRPGATDTSDLGSTSARWRNGYLVGLDVQTSAGRFIVAPAGSASVKLSSSATMQYDVGAASTHQFLVNGADVASIGAAGLSATYAKTTAWGTAANPAVAIGGYANGLYNDASTRLGFAVGGARVARLDAAFLIPGEDATMDLGIPTYQWKTGNFSNGVFIAGNAAWHAGNDGSGSGLDADLLDGQQGSYYLPAASYTAADVRAKLLTVDGAGSGLDADLLDGRHASEFVLGTSFAASFAQNGYQVLPNGLIIQWGRFAALPNQYTSASLPVTFPNQAFSAVVAGVAGGGADSQDNAPSITSLSTSQIQVFSADNSTTTMHFIAIGY